MVTMWPPMNAKHDSNHTPSGEQKKSNTVFLYWFVLGVVIVLTGLTLVRFDLTIKTEGRVYHDNEENLFAPRQALIREIVAREGTPVAAGETIMVLRDEALEARLLEQRLAWLENRYALQSRELALRTFELRPGNVSLMVAGERAKLLTEIAIIQKDIVDHFESLVDARAVRSLDLKQQRIAHLRTLVDQLETEQLKEWLMAGSLVLDREQIELDLERLGREADVMKEEITRLEALKESLIVRAPVSGVVASMPRRYSGMAVAEGDFICRVIDTTSAWMVKALVGERNVDLIQPGTPARMESQVFDSILEGYVRGTVVRVAPEAEYDPDPGNPPVYRIYILVESTPYPLVPGSSLAIHLLLGKQNVWDILTRRASNRRTLYDREDS